MSKFKRDFKLEVGNNMRFWCNKTGVYGNGSFQARHYWVGIKGLIGFGYSVTW